VAPPSSDSRGPNDNEEEEEACDCRTNKKETPSNLEVYLRYYNRRPQRKQFTMLIEEIASTTTTTPDRQPEDIGHPGVVDDGKNAGHSSTTASRAVDALVQHYSQPIHLVEDGTELSRRREVILIRHSSPHCQPDGARRNDSGGSSINHSRPVALPPVLQTIWKQMERPNSSSSSANDDIARGLLSLYPTKIRTCWLEGTTSTTTKALLPRQQHTDAVRRSGIPVLIHYELLVSAAVARAWGNADSDGDEQQDVVDDGDPAAADAPAAVLDDAVDWNTTQGQLLQILASDITQAQISSSSSVGQEETVSSDAKALILPTLLRLVHHTTATTNTDTTIDLAEMDGARRCVCSLLPLSLSLTSVADMMNSNLQSSALHIWQFLVYPPPPQSTTDTETIDDPCNYNIPKESWKLVGLDTVGATTYGSFGEDASAEILVDIWKDLGRDRADGGDDGAALVDDTTNCIRNGLRHFGWKEMAASLRSHFFGEDVPFPSDKIVVPSRPTLLLGRTVRDRGTDLVERKPEFVQNPSRLFAALHFVFLLDSIDGTAVLEELLPILRALITASDQDHNRWGAACLFHLCQITPATVWRNMDVAACENLVTLLYDAVKTCRNGPTLVLLGLAQRHLFLRLTADADASRFAETTVYKKKQLQATQQWLLILDRNNRHYVREHLIWGVLVAVLPLLHDHARSADEWEALELGRLGLSALLPVLRGASSGLVIDDVSESKDERIFNQTAEFLALAALCNLIVAAYPIVPHHIGKITCELIAYLRRTHGAPTHPLSQATHRLVYHVFDMIVVLSMGSVVQILDSIRSSKPGFDAAMMQILGDLEKRLTS
jgi:hypothetical protein